MVDLGLVSEFVILWHIYLLGSILYNDISLLRSQQN